MSKSVKKSAVKKSGLSSPHSILGNLGISSSPKTIKKNKQTVNEDISITGSQFYKFIRTATTAKPKIIIMGKNVVVSSTQKGPTSSSLIGKEAKRFAIKTHRRPVRNKKIKANPAVAEDIDYIKVVCVDDKFVTPNLRLNPEAVAFLFHIDGCAKNLALFILLKELDYNSGQYKFNQHIVDDFIEYSNQLFYTKYKVDTVKKAHRTLVEQNLTTNISRGIYLINPLFVGGKNETGRRILISDYNKHLRTKKSADVVQDIYPLFVKKS